MYAVDSVEGPYNSAKKYDEGNLGHRPGVKGGYFPVPPVDSGQDIRSEMLSVMSNMGVLLKNTTTKFAIAAWAWYEIWHTDWYRR